MKFFSAVGRGPRTNGLAFGVDLGKDHYPGFLNPGQDPYPEIFHCPAWMISLAVEDISSYLILKLNNLKILVNGCVHNL